MGCLEPPIACRGSENVVMLVLAGPRRMREHVNVAQGLIQSCHFAPRAGTLGFRIVIVVIVLVAYGLP